MIVLVLELVLIYFVSRLVLKEIFLILNKFTNRNNLIYSMVALIYLPGTLVHEISHFLAALVLMLPVKKISIFPVFEKNEIKLGSVEYTKRDFLRGIIVGVSPVIFGMFTISLIFYFNIFPSNKFFLNLLFSYLIFSISSNMFSSKRDLQDLFIAIPVFFIILLVFYLLGLKINLSFLVLNNNGILSAILKEVNISLGIVFLINLSFFYILRFINLFFAK
ncbi:MAG: putative membrane protein [Candidatus Roizmanbacteria bacterium GW2011_GWA2_35_19]|uniref:Putative membrane protein n=1 Tax=Candidatus Roizmanbacteria bacterium GW2011_GWA2_35_19 TaxID=1618478 RepID=A0A0G0C9R1_9BACT|nr:MAG: putative membrane protein [Candidatus Roizmanbacteria bacterium GW2011_GWA2_35_19]